MMTLLTGHKTDDDSVSAKAFTLIELILVMALMVVVIGLLASSLGNFFRGRTLDSEARRFLALARYGHSRAVSEGVPMLLWLDPDRRTYGLTEEFSYSARDDKAIQYQLEPELELELEQYRISTSKRSTIMPSGLGLGVNAVAIRFEPDGFVSEESPVGLWLRERKGQGQVGRTPNVIWITQDQNRVNYEIQTNIMAGVRR